MYLSHYHTLSESYPQAVYLRTVTRTYGNIATLKAPSAIKANFKRFVNAVYKETGILLLAYSGQRSYPAQWELRKKYLEGGNRAALPGYSWHNFGRGMDMVPIKVDGSADWKTRDWARIHKIAERFGIENGRSYSDPGHFLQRGDTTLSLQRGMLPGWETYANYEQESGITKQKDTETPQQFKVGKYILGAGILTGLFFGGRYLYQKYA